MSLENMNYFQKNNLFHNDEYSILTVDIGTSGCRSILFSDSGLILSKAEKSYTYYYNSKNGFAEQDPDLIYKSFIEVANECLSNKKPPVKYITLGSVLQSLILVDKKGKLLTPLTIWADNRSISQCQKIEEFYKKKDWYNKTGCPLSPVYPLYRLLWYKEHFPNIFNNFAKAVSIKSYILHRIFDTYIEDYSVASGTGFFNIHTLGWDNEILDYIEISKDKLPAAVPVEHRIGDHSLTQNNDKLLIDKKTVWIVGSSDGPLAHLGSAGRDENIASLTIGTSAAMRMCFQNPKTDRDGNLWCYVLDNDYFAAGFASNNGGNVVDWYVDTFLPKGTSWQDIETRLLSTEFDCGLMFFPFLFSERIMHKSGSLSAIFIGLKPQHTKNDLLSAVIEGVVFNVVSLFERLNAIHKILKITFSGSMTKSGFVQELLFTLIQCPIFEVCIVNASLSGSFSLITENEIKVKKDNIQIENNYKNNMHDNNEIKNVFSKNNEYSEKYLKWTKYIQLKSCL